LTSTLVDDLKQFGVARTHVLAVFRECLDTWLQLKTLAKWFSLSARVAEARRAFERGEHRESLKQFLVKYQDRQTFQRRHPLYALGQRAELRDVAGQAVGTDMGLYSADLWYVLPQASGRAREWSQNWHRDPEGPKTVKVFAYMEDVTDDAGPFEFVPGSHVGGPKYQQVGREAHYGDQAEINAIPDADKCRFTVPAGTVLFANTSGLHRGGYTTTRPRLNVCWTYLPCCEQRPPLYALEN
jgi:hypothetical protein